MTAANRSSLAPRRAAGRRWRRAFAVVAGLCLLVFAVNAQFFEVNPGNPWGLGYGIAAALLLLVTALYSLRRRFPRWATRRRLGSARTWLYLHLYGGALFALLMLMHSGFSVPTGAVTWWLWLLSLWTVASGLAGLALQQWIPRVLGSSLEVEAIYERIPELVHELSAEADALATTCVEPVQTLYSRRLAPALASPQPRLRFYFDATGGRDTALKEVEVLHPLLPPEEQAKLAGLSKMYRTKTQLDAQFTLQRGLRLWLWAHVPVSTAVLVLLAVHLFAVWYY
ncbi:MAG: hypothetical protein AAF481_14345 [Acidobacteriota bacterium]